MARRARWIRLGRVDAQELRAAFGGLCAVQARDAAPIVLWACEDLVPVSARQYRFVVIAPARLAPGCAARWLAWALSPAVAAYRDFGLRAYLDGADICVHGCTIASARAEAIHDRAVITVSLQANLDGVAVLEPALPRAAEFRAWLREGLGLAMTQWGGDGEMPPERALEAALRARIEAQHGWQFENSWPDASERSAIEAARLEWREPIGRELPRRVAGVLR